MPCDLEPLVPRPSLSPQASVLPGIVRKPVWVAVADLAQRFPGTPVAVLDLTQSLLAGVSTESRSPTLWLTFGVPAQEAVSQLIKERLSLMEDSPSRSATQHLKRLHSVLGEVLDALDGGFLRKSAHRVWASRSAEVRQLERLLETVSPHLRETGAQLDDLKNRTQACLNALRAHALATSWLNEQLPAELESVLLSRQAALHAAYALALEQVQALESDQLAMRELYTLVQDSVLLQLPSIHSQLAGLSAKPSETQRFMAQEPLAELVSLIQRRM